MMKTFMMTVCLSFLVLGCDDSSPSNANTSDAGGQADMGMSQADVGPSAVDQGASTQDAGSMAMADPAYVEASLSPRRSLYTLSDVVEVRYTVFDRIGREIPGFEAAIDVLPAGQAEVDAARQLTFLAEGAGAVRVCATPDICGRASFFVDDAPPSLVIESPDRGQLITGEPEIVVVGRTDPDPAIRVFVNDVPVETDETGAFEYRFRARFGLNRIDVVADDGVRRPATRSVREVVWSPTTVPLGEGPFAIDDITILRLDQLLMDSGEPPGEPDAAGLIRVGDLAGVIEVLLARAELIGLIDDTQVADSDNFSLRIAEVNPGQADPTLILTNSGLEVFLRLEDVEMVTEGQLEFEGEEISLNGRIAIDVAGFGSLRFVIDDQGQPGFVVEDVGLAVEDLSSEMDDSTAQALIDTVGSIVRTTMNRVAEEFMRDLIQTEVPEFIGLGIDDLLDPLRRIEIDQDADGFLPAINVQVALQADRPSFVRREHFEIVLDGVLDSNRAAPAPHPIAGIPAFPLDSEPVWPAQGAATLAVRLLTLNVLTTSIWRQGALQMDLSERVGGLLPQIERIWLDARLPPLVVPSPVGAPQSLELQIGEIDVFVQNPANPEPDRYVMSLRTGLNIGIRDGALQSAVDEELDVRVELVDRGGDELPLDPALFATLARTQLGETLTESLTDLIQVDIPPIEMEAEAFQGLAPSVQSISLRPQFPERLEAQNGWLVLPAVGEIELVIAP